MTNMMLGLAVFVCTWFASLVIAVDLTRGIITTDPATFIPTLVQRPLHQQQVQKHEMPHSFPSNRIGIRNGMLNPRTPHETPWFEFQSPAYGAIVTSSSTVVQFRMGGFIVPRDGTLVFSSHKFGANDQDVSQGLNCTWSFNPSGQCNGVLR
jgi:hypothetical protein